MFNFIINGLKFILKSLIVLFLTIVQFVYIFNLFNLNIQNIYLSLIVYFFQLLCIFMLGNKKYNNDFNILWLIGIVTLPIIIIPIYFFSLYVRFVISNKMSKCVSYPNLEKKEINSFLEKENKLLSNISKFIDNSSKTGFRYCDKYIYYNSGDVFFPEFIKDLMNAKKYIFINFFIIAKGNMWLEIKDILISKMDEGVEVYLIFDHLGSFFRYPRDIKKIKHKNFHLCIFNTLLSGISPYINGRNHRKIIVIDGEIGYIGGLNIADEYINKGNFKGKWKDVAIKVNQNIVNDLVSLFITLWNNGCKEKIKDINYFISNDKIINKDNGYVIQYSDNLYNKYFVSKNIYIQCINLSKNYIYIMTPYLILDEEVRNTLIRNSRNGIDVRIITPKKPDNIFVHTVTRSYYSSLLEAGVNIYEYSPGFIHAKNMIVDDNIGIIGSANFDFRSMYMLYENSILAYNVDELKKIKNDFIETFNQSQKIELDKWKKRNIFEKIVEGFLKIFSPLL